MLPQKEFMTNLFSSLVPPRLKQRDIWLESLVHSNILKMRLTALRMTLNFRFSSLYLQIVGMTVICRCARGQGYQAWLCACQAGKLSTALSYSPSSSPGWGLWKYRKDQEGDHTTLCGSNTQTGFLPLIYPSHILPASPILKKKRCPS